MPARPTNATTPPVFTALTPYRLVRQSDLYVTSGYRVLCAPVHGPLQSVPRPSQITGWSARSCELLRIVSFRIARQLTHR